MNATPAERLRNLLGEPIRPGAEADSTMFSDEEIDDFLEMAHDNVKAAAYEGWLVKMANYANLVTVNEGNASRELTELHKNAKRMVDQYAGYAITPGRGRARIGNITRNRV